MPKNQNQRPRFTVYSKVRLDEIDWRILNILQCDGRCSFSDLARQVKLSAPAVSERVKRLEAERVITGFSANIDPTPLGISLTAIIRLAVPTGAQCTTLLKSLAKFSEVLHAYRVTGTESAVIIAVVESGDHLQNLIDRMTTLGKPTTSIATSSYIRSPAIDKKSFPERFRDR